MRIINGLICLARVEREKEFPYRFRHYFFFGKKVNETDGEFENIGSNNITPYSTLKEAEQGQKELLEKRRLFDEVEIRRLEMMIAQTREEYNSFEKKRNLVVVWKNDMGEHLIGRSGEGVPSLYPRYGAQIERNGFRPYTDFRDADYSRSEASRQARSPATLATFKLSKVLSRRRRK